MKLCKQCNAGGSVDCCFGYDIYQASCEFGNVIDPKGNINLGLCVKP